MERQEPASEQPAGRHACEEAAGRDESADVLGKLADRAGSVEVVTDGGRAAGSRPASRAPGGPGWAWCRWRGRGAPGRC